MNGYFIKFAFGFCFIESRETAYIHAINAASLSWSITRSCSRGDLTECSCDNSIRRKQRKWQWGGCSEVNYTILFIFNIFYSILFFLNQLLIVKLFAGCQLWGYVFTKIHRFPGEQRNCSRFNESS